MPFSNTQLEISSLPSASTLVYKELNKDYLTASLIATLFTWIIIGVVAGIGLQMGQTDEEFNEIVGAYTQFIIIGLCALAVLSLLVTYFGFFKKGYAVREKDISYKTGLWWKSKTLIPFNRIQHCEVKQGPFERLFGLSSLRAFTAGGSASDLSINGLRQDEANHLKQYIITKTSADEEE